MMPKDYYERAIQKATSPEVREFLVWLRGRADTLEQLQSGFLESIKSNRRKRGEKPPRLSRKDRELKHEFEAEVQQVSDETRARSLQLESDESLLRVALMVEQEQLRFDTSMRDFCHSDDCPAIDRIIEHHRATVKAIEYFTHKRQ
jgi:hypothetical protein